MKPFISTAVYGVFNYIISLTLIASPWLFNLVHVSSAAIFIPLYIGWLQLIMAIFSRNETGFIKQFPVQIHYALDVVMGFLLFVSPFLYTFSSKIWWPEVLFGGLLMFFGTFAQKSPFTTKTHHAISEGGLISTDSTDGRLMK